MKKRVIEELRRNFRPEFLNRLDGTVVFRALTKEEIHEIVELRLDEVRELMKEHQLGLSVSDVARAYLGAEGYDPDYGARPLRRAITNLLEDRLSDGILSGEFQPKSTVYIDMETDEDGKEQLILTASAPEEDDETTVEAAQEQAPEPTN